MTGARAADVVVAQQPSLFDRFRTAATDAMAMFVGAEEEATSHPRAREIPELPVKVGILTLLKNGQGDYLFRNKHLFKKYNLNFVGTSESAEIRKGTHPLFVAIDRKDGAAVDTLINNGADVNFGIEAAQAALLKEDEHKGKTPLLRAIDHNSLELVKKLIERGANTEKSPAGTKVPLAYATEKLEALYKLYREVFHTDVNNMKLIVEALGGEPKLVKMKLKLQALAGNAADKEPRGLVGLKLRLVAIADRLKVLKAKIAEVNALATPRDHPETFVDDSDGEFFDIPLDPS